jgi:hypothetical protein
MEEQIGYILIYCRILMGMGTLFILFAFAAFLAAIEGNDKENKSKADEGLVFCKLGQNYCWLTPAEYGRLCLTDRSE